VHWKKQQTGNNVPYFFSSREILSAANYLLNFFNLDSNYMNEYKAYLHFPSYMFLLYLHSRRIYVNIRIIHNTLYAVSASVKKKMMMPSGSIESIYLLAFWHAISHSHTIFENMSQWFFFSCSWFNKKIMSIFNNTIKTLWPLLSQLLNEEEFKGAYKK
jgi:hypothetical protein